MHKIAWTTENVQGTSWSIQFETKQRKIYRIDEHMKRDLKVSETIANHRVVDTMLKMQENKRRWKFDMKIQLSYEMPEKYLQIFEYHHGVWCKSSNVV